MGFLITLITHGSPGLMTLFMFLSPGQGPFCLVCLVSLRYHAAKENKLFNRKKSICVMLEWC